VNQEGIRSSGAFVRSPLTGWAVAIGVPKDALELPYAWIIPGGIGLLLIGLFLATWLGQHISQPVAQLGSLANALGKRAPLAAFRSGIIEVDQVVKSLELASSELDRSEKQLRGAIQLRDGFLSVASHELKTPLTSLQLQLQLNMMRASENTDSSSAFHTGLKVTLGQVERLIRLVNNLLDVTQITSGKMRMHLEPVDLAELANEIVSSFQFEVQKHRTSIQLEIQARPKACWDRGRVEQVLTNLVSNAIKYGEGRPAIVRIGALSDRAFIEVVDQGIGIHAEDLARIFERFERATSSSHISGLGLGLWITRRIVEQLGGKIGVQSVLNQGSAFTVELPLQ
jgi:signal transduction histidine kinase